MADRIVVVLETTPKKTFATAVDWPGWSRSGKTADLALEALAAYAARYRPIADAAGETLADELAFEVVASAEGGSGTEFGVPSRVTDQDRRPTSSDDADRLARLVRAAWEAFEQTAAAAPAELRKGPRGGGRDTAKMVDHVVGADHAYAREIGVRVRPPAPDDRPAVDAMRDEILDVLRRPSDGSPLADRKWTARYAAHRIAWHALDHAWEIEDRSEPA
jgi:hypothetical protein